MLIKIVYNILSERKLSPVASTSISNHQFSNNLDAKADSGASKHFFKTDHIKYLKNITKLDNGPNAQLPNNMIVQATHKGQLNLHQNLSSKASKVLIFPHVINKSLLLIGQLWDDNCIVISDKIFCY